MKKFLVLSLVLGIASLASAGYTLVVDGELVAGNTVKVSVVADAEGISSSEYAYFALVSDAGTVSGGSVEGDASSLFGGSYLSYFPTTEAGIDGYWGQYNGATFAADTAVVSEVDFLVTGVGTLDLYTSPDFANFSVQSMVVPEPATMALLGLGALVLRRKK